MYKSILLSALFAVGAHAYGYGDAAGPAAAVVGGPLLAGGPAPLLAGGPAPLLAGGPGPVLAGPVSGAPGPLAMITNQQVHYVDTPSRGYAHPTNVFVDSQSSPVNLVFRTLSAPVHVEHHHAPAPGSFRATASEDEPHTRVHTVTKPVVQEIREIIVPQRLVRQEVMPVNEQIQTQVARHIPAGPILAPAGPALAAGPGGFALGGPGLAAGPAGFAFGGPAAGPAFFGGLGIKCAGAGCGGPVALAGPALAGPALAGPGAY